MQLDSYSNHYNNADEKMKVNVTCVLSDVLVVLHGWRRRGGKPFTHQAGVCLWSKLQKQCQLFLHSCSDSHRYL